MFAFPLPNSYFGKPSNTERLLLMDSSSATEPRAKFAEAPRQATGTSMIFMVDEEIGCCQVQRAGRAKVKPEFDAKA